MAATMAQVVTGIAKYINSEFVEQVEGLKKWAVIGAASLAVDKVDAVGAAIQKSQIARSFGVIGEDGSINIDALKSCLDAAADSTGPVVQQIPLLGPVTFKKEDIQKVYDYIKNS
jgi:hypothetical protein